MIATAINEGLNYEQITQKAQELGINLEQPHLQQFLVDKYIAKQAEES